MPIRMFTTALLLPLCLALPARTGESTRPNIVFILADDMGYGEIQALNPTRSNIPTPHLDQLARDGIRFTDAHSGSSVCTPTRYGLLTGRYAWRTRLQRGVLTGGGPCLIAKDTTTLGGLLQEQGYHTALIGKWHLNWFMEGELIQEGPLDRGFDFFFGFHHARDMRTVARDRNIIGARPVEAMLDSIGTESVQYIERRAGLAGHPFFLYVPLSSPHTPIVPSAAWQGKSGISPYADFVMQTDHVVGRIVKAVDKAGLSENTLIVFSSDNGTSKAAQIGQLQKHGHFPSGDLRGSKADIWDGGHRVPFLARWRGTVKAGSSSQRLICLTDTLATVAQLVSRPLQVHEGVDSVSFLDALLGRESKAPRGSVVHHSINGRFAIRENNWKLVLCPGSGGWSEPKDKQATRQGLSPIQLYDMHQDIGERKNVQADHPQRVRDMLRKLETLVARGRSTPGPEQENDVNGIDLWKVTPVPRLP